MRLYIQPSWVDAASDHNDWSGGNGEYRGDKSVDVETFDSKGRARVEAFTEEAIESRKSKAVKKPKSAYAAISLPDRHFERMCELSEGLDRDYEENKLSHEDYIYAKKLIEERKAKAWGSLCRARGWNEDDKEIYEEDSFNKEYSFKNSLKEESSFDNIFLSLRDDNCFKRLYLVIKYIRGIFK